VSLDVHNDAMLDIDEVIQAMAGLHPLVGFGLLPLISMK
jgi:hypothetical protein